MHDRARLPGQGVLLAAALPAALALALAAGTAGCAPPWPTEPPPPPELVHLPVSAEGDRREALERAVDELLAERPALFGAPGATGPLARALAEGGLGERVDGRVAPVPADPDPSLLELAERRNAARERAYRELAEREGARPEDVAHLAGDRLVARAPKGRSVMGARGRWHRVRGKRD